MNKKINIGTLQEIPPNFIWEKGTPKPESLFFNEDSGLKEDDFISDGHIKDDFLLLVAKRSHLFCLTEQLSSIACLIKSKKFVSSTKNPAQNTDVGWFNHLIVKNDDGCALYEVLHLEKEINLLGFYKTVENLDEDGITELVDRFEKDLISSFKIEEYWTFMSGIDNEDPLVLLKKIYNLNEGNINDDSTFHNVTEYHLKAGSFPLPIKIVRHPKCFVGNWSYANHIFTHLYSS